LAFKKDLSTLVLGVLQDDGLHGYEIAKRIREVSVKSLQVAEGRLYPALHKLELEGLIQAEWIPQEGRPPRKVYSLTDEGRSELAKQRSEWRAFADSVDAILNPGQPGRMSMGRMNVGLAGVPRHWAWETFQEAGRLLSAGATVCPSILRRSRHG